MTPLPKNLAAVVHKINDNVISDCQDTSDPSLPYFLANGRAFYDRLFVQAMIDEVKAEKRRDSEASNAKKLKEAIDVSTIGLNKKV